MYNKIFTKILDSSIWLESDSTRIVWLTMLASMDQDGFCQFASAANLAHRAIVPLAATESALKILESPDKNSADQDNEGRRIERVDGGWMVLNATKYRDIVTSSESRKKNRERVQRFRNKQKGDVCNALRNDPVMQSEAVAIANADLNPLPPLEEQKPSAYQEGQVVEMDIYSASRTLGELIGIGHSGSQNLHRLTSAINQAERRWKGKARVDVVNGVFELWKEYCAQGHHAPIALHNWLDQVGRFIDSRDWVKAKPVEFKPHIDWQGGYIGPDGVYVTKAGKRVPGYKCPPKPTNSGAGA